MGQAARVPDQTRHRNHGERLLAVAAPQSQPRHTCLAVAAVAVPPRWPLLLPVCFSLLLVPSSPCPIESAAGPRRRGQHLHCTRRRARTALLAQMAPAAAARWRAVDAFVSVPRGELVNPRRVTSDGDVASPNKANHSTTAPRTDGVRPPFPTVAVTGVPSANSSHCSAIPGAVETL